MEPNNDLEWASAAVASLLKRCMQKAAVELEAQAYALQKLAARLRKET